MGDFNAENNLLRAMNAKLKGRNDTLEAIIANDVDLEDRIAELEAKLSQSEDSYSFMSTLVGKLGNENKALQKWIEIAGGISCPNCDNSGVNIIRDDCGSVEQCQFCYECPDSVFNKSQEEK